MLYKLSKILVFNCFSLKWQTKIDGSSCFVQKSNQLPIRSTFLKKKIVAQGELHLIYRGLKNQSRLNYKVGNTTFV